MQTFCHLCVLTCHLFIRGFKIRSRLLSWSYTVSVWYFQVISVQILPCDLIMIVSGSGGAVGHPAVTGSSWLMVCSSESSFPLSVSVIMYVSFYISPHVKWSLFTLKLIFFWMNSFFYIKVKWFFNLAVLMVPCWIWRSAGMATRCPGLEYDHRLPLRRVSACPHAKENSRCHFVCKCDSLRCFQIAEN